MSKYTPNERESAYRIETPEDDLDRTRELYRLSLHRGHRWDQIAYSAAVVAACVALGICVGIYVAIMGGGPL